MRNSIKRLPAELIDKLQRMDQDEEDVVYWRKDWTPEPPSPPKFELLGNYDDVELLGNYDED